MCGICGIFLRGQPVERQVIEQMTRRLTHRGPNGEGIWLEDNIALGHRRLSIIDLETGQQPMCNEDQDIWISYNGELYNFLELKERLSASGHVFRTHSDTEVVVHAYEEWGDSCLEHFRGMFAFGLVDLKRKRIFLARDPFGIKPLVYYWDGRCFAFASEIQALKAAVAGRLSLNLVGLDFYLWLQYIPAPWTIYEQVRKLPPACSLSLGFGGELSAPRSYWRPDFVTERRMSEEEWIGELDAVLAESVRMHLVSDVPFGAFLSGGIDSSAVVSYMAQAMNRPVKTFTIGFAEKEFDESAYAETVAKRWQTDHYLEIVRPNALAILPQLVRHYGEPFGDPSAVPTYYLSQMAQRHVPMVLSGDGGDELFGGYNTYIAWKRWLSFDFNKPWKRFLHRRLPFILPRIYRERPATMVNWLGFVQWAPLQLRQQLWRREWLQQAGMRHEDFLHEIETAGEGRGPVTRAQSADLQTYLPYAVLTKVDVASMMNSLEVRVPILDKRVFELAAAIPEECKIARQADGRWEGKLLLKKVLRRYFPDDFLGRRKMGFATPLRLWFAAGREGGMERELRQRLLDPSSPLFEYFDLKAVADLFRSRRTSLIWLMLFLDEWLRQNMTPSAKA